MTSVCTGCCRQNVNILYEKKEEMNESMMITEIQRIQNLIQAKKEFNDRKDINFYMTAEDLSKIQSMKKVNIKLTLCIDDKPVKDTINVKETLSKKLSPRHISSTNINNSKDNKIMPLQSGSATSSLADLNEILRSQGNIGFTSSQPPSPTHLKSSRKTSTADKTKIDKICINPHVITSAQLNTKLQKVIDLVNYKVDILYHNESVAFSTFLIERLVPKTCDDVLQCICMGISYVVLPPFDEHFTYKSDVSGLNAEFQLVSKEKLNHPITYLYVHTLTTGKEFTTTQIVENFQDIIFQCK
jgi:hypothetical protein